MVTIGVIIEHTGQVSGRGEAAEGPALESPLPIIVSLFLAAAMWRRPATATLAIVVLFSLAAALLDGLELAHLTDRPTMAVLTAITSLTHLAAAYPSWPVNVDRRTRHWSAAFPSSGLPSVTRGLDGRSRVRPHRATPGSVAPCRMVSLAIDHASITQPSAMDAEMAPIRREMPGQGHDRSAPPGT